MNIFLPTTFMFTLALVVITLDRVEAYNQSPCQSNGKNDAHKRFVLKHILQETFDTGSIEEWERYLKKYKLCERPQQSFMQPAYPDLVVQTCNEHGRILRGNLCTSTSSMWVYELDVNTANCKVTKLRKEEKYVVVACDKVSNLCLPVHYEGSNNNPPSSGKICRPQPSG